MNNQAFVQFWVDTFPDTIPVANYFKHDYPDEWFRVHSMPDGQRYANTDMDWSTLLHRQNEVLSTMLGEGESAYLLVADYSKQQEGGPKQLAEDALKGFKFEALEPLDLHDISPEEFGPGSYYRMALAPVKWTAGTFDPVLIDIANEKYKAFFFSVNRKCIVAPYVGGLDIVELDRNRNKQLKEQFAAYLSKRRDGF